MAGSTSWLLATLVLAIPSQAIFRPQTPPMGWNSYNYYSCYPNETIIKDNAKGLVDLGFADLGYNYVTPDCGWPNRDRNADGSIAWNATLFPSGFPALGEYIHGLGLLFGLYSGAGIWECDVVGGASHLQASLGHEQQDAATFASWGMDALKYDNCWPNDQAFTDYDQTNEDIIPRFTAMSDALNEIDRDVVYSICEWGTGTNLGTWAAELGDTWRISNDIQNNWRSIWRISNEVVPYVKYVGVGMYPDMDMLTIGLKVLSEEEEKFEFTMWAINKSPLIIGAPMNAAITPQSSLDILSNKGVIEINQDALGEQASLVRRYTEEEYDIWAGNLTEGRKVVAIPNWSNDTKEVNVDLASALGLESVGTITDVWHDVPVSSDPLQMSLTLAGHEARLLVLSDLTYSAPAAPGAYYSAADATLDGGANLVSCDAGTCQPTSQKVQDVVNGASVTFKNVAAADSTATRLVGIDFINYDIALASAWSNGTNTRNLTVAVNDGTPKRWAFPISGGNWSDTGRLNVEVDGFVAGTGNTVRLASLDQQYGPDVVGLEVM